jgi:predicted N-formylglutamate amidohydrolase
VPFYSGPNCSLPRGWSVAVIWKASASLIDALLRQSSAVDSNYPYQADDNSLSFESRIRLVAS